MSNSNLNYPSQYSNPDFVDIANLFADKRALLINTVSVIICKGVRMVDMVYFAMLVQTHPYFNGLFLGKIKVTFIIFLAATCASLLANFFIAFFITKKSNLSMLVLISVFLYPGCATLINYVYYKNYILMNVIFFACEFIKFLILYTLDEGQKEIIKAVNHRRSIEKFRAMSYLLQNIFMAVMFGLFGPIITFLSHNLMFKNLRPFNYLVAFSTLSFALGIAYILKTVSRRN